MKKYILTLMILGVQAESLISMEIPKQTFKKPSEKQIGMNMLCNAAYSGDLKEVQQYIKHAGEKSVSGKTALMCQFILQPEEISNFSHQDLEITKLLLTKEDVNAVYQEVLKDRRGTIIKDENGQEIIKIKMTALLYALEKARNYANQGDELNIESAKSIIEALVSAMEPSLINMQNQSGETALSIAEGIKNGSPLVQLLLNKGANPFIVPQLKGQSAQDACALALCRAMTSLGDTRTTVEALKAHFKKADPLLEQRIRIFSKKLTFESGL